MARIEGLRLKNYRVIETAEIKLINGIAVIVGRNGVGKTTVMDALLFLKKSFEDLGKAIKERGETASDITLNKDAQRDTMIEVAFTLSREQSENIFGSNPAHRGRSELPQHLKYELLYGQGGAQETLSAALPSFRDDYRALLKTVRQNVGGDTRIILADSALFDERNRLTQRTSESSVDPLTHNLGFERHLQRARNVSDWHKNLAGVVKSELSKVDLISPNRHFNDSMDIRKISTDFEPDLRNLVEVVESIGSREPALLEEIVRELREFLPDIDDLKSRAPTDSSLARTIAFYTSGTKRLSRFYSMGQTSFGTKSIVAFVTKVLTLQPDTVLCIEEPELHLHPHAQSLLSKRSPIRHLTLSELG